MSCEGQRVAGVRDLTEEEARIIGRFPHGWDTLTGLELENGNVIFPSGDEEGNIGGFWPVTREELEEFAGMYVVGWRKKKYESDVVPANRPPLQLVLAAEEPTLDEDGQVVDAPEDTVRIEPCGDGVGPAAWYVREPVDEDDRPNPEETPTPKEVVEMRFDDEITQEEYNEMIGEAERAHNDAVFLAIC